ncbi:MAG: hypothetical protein ABSE82_16480, partial [Nitrososphaerales archaeon]
NVSMRDIYTPLRLPEFDSSRGSGPVLEWMENWTSSEALSDLVEIFGGIIPSSLALTKRLNYLSDFSSRWDFRQGRERNLAPPIEADEMNVQCILAAAALGLSGESSLLHDSYDHIVILGGLARACISRPRFAHSILKDVSSQDVVALGSFRALADDELSIARSVGLVGYRDEFTLLDAGTRQAFDITVEGHTRQQNESDDNPLWLIRNYEEVEGRRISIIAAPSTDPTRRANTPDTYEFYARNVATLSPGSRILLVTSQIYRVFQCLDAIRLLGLPWDVSIEVVGVGPQWANELVLRQNFTPAQYLQEVRSSIRSIAQLLPEIVSK